MNNVHCLFATALALTVLAGTACGDDDSTSNQTTTSTSSSGTGGSGSGGQGTGGSTSTSSSSSSTGTGGSACDTWLVTYDLTGSDFIIDALIDFAITLQEPYNEDHNMGPGTITLRFGDDGGAPGAGPVTIVDYHMTQNFVTGNQLATVTTTLETSAVDGCGAATGELAGSTLTWTPATMQPYCRDGQVSCTGVACGTMGSPPANQPFVFDNDCSEPLPLDAFEFTNGLTDFTMAGVVTSQDNNQTTTLSLVGTQVDMQLDPATPGCACD